MSQAETKSDAPNNHEDGRARYPLRGVLVFAIAGIFFGVLGSGYVKCPFYALFHFPCPACGTNRAGHAVLDLDVHEALRTNPVAPFAIAMLVMLFARAAFLEYRDGSLRRLGEGRVGEWMVRWLVRLVWISIAVWLLRALGFFGGLPDQ